MKSGYRQSRQRSSLTPQPLESTETSETYSQTRPSEVLRELDVRAPRYTSYPTADRFNDEFGADNFKTHLRKRRTDKEPLSIYVHLPFCQSLCYFCACNKKITQDIGVTASYLDCLERELELITTHIGSGHRVSQMHWGGGTPTFLSNDDIRVLMRILRERLDFMPAGEYSIEIDPRAVDDEKIQLLAEEGFNRMSLGVQDFHPEVQRAVNRLQSAELTERVLKCARAAGFESTNFDLIYGLPKQSVKRFEQTINEVIAMRPERIALYNYAHLPSRFRAQRLILDTDLPSPEEKIMIFEVATQLLEQAGYEYIGMDHFAVPNDELAVALREGKLHRNFQGYSTQADRDLIGLGASAISKIGDCYSQNLRGINEYSDALNRDELATLRGIELDANDRTRRAVIMALMCRGTVDKMAIEDSVGGDFDRYFGSELNALVRFEQLGLVDLNASNITVTDVGRRTALRAISAEFDTYLQADDTRKALSRVL